MHTKKEEEKKICNLWQSSWTWHFDTFHSRVLHLYQDLSWLSSLFPDFDHRIYFSAWINVKRRSWICALFVTRNLYRAHLLGKSSQKSNWGEDWGEGRIQGSHNIKNPERTSTWTGRKTTASFPYFNQRFGGHLCTWNQYDSGPFFLVSSQFGFDSDADKKYTVSRYIISTWSFPPDVPLLFPQSSIHF